MPPAASSFERPARIASLDGLRAVCILFVLMEHARHADGYSQARPIQFFSHFGRLGVFTFFVISGFPITDKLVEEHGKRGRIDLAHFYKRRFYRIVPASYVYAFLAIAVTLATGGHMTHLSIAAPFLFAGGLVTNLSWPVGHFWTLGAEEQFYMVWPFVMVAAYRWRKWAAVTIIVASALIRIAFFHSGWRDAAGYTTPCVADNLAAGCLIALCADQMKKLPPWVKSLPFTTVLIAASALGMHHSAYLNSVEMSIVSMTIALTVWVLIERKDWLLNNAAIKYVGKLSYSIYLVQQPFLDPYAHRIWNRFPYSIMATAICALAMYYLVEQPMLRLGYKSKSAPKTVYSGGSDATHMIVLKTAEASYHMVRSSFKSSHLSEQVSTSASMEPSHIGLPHPSQRLN